MIEQDLLIILFDYYEELLTDSQKKYFIDYYFNNLSLAEIAENENVSRNAVSKDLKLTKEKLIELEEQLKLNEKKEKLVNLLTDKVDKKLLEEIKELL